MREIFSPPGRERLKHLVRRKALLAFDFDGTLSPIVPNPDDAFVPARTAYFLNELQAFFPLAIISGRSAGDVRARLQGTNVQIVIGNHGIEPSPFMTEAAASVGRWAPTLEHSVGRLPGVRVENKGYSLAIHYRDALPDGAADSTRLAILDALTILPEAVRVVEGIFVVNVLPPGAPHKGEALRRTQRQLRAETSLYVGDDATDEDAFHALDHELSISVRVGRNHASAASYYVKNQLQLDRLLETLLTMRSELPPPSTLSASP